jgi:uncharacterized repeat protein (TIGR01451 family)
MLRLPSPAPILSAKFMSNIMARFRGLLRTPKRPAISRVVYVILLALLLGTGFAQRASAQINVSPNSEGNTLGAACSLQEAIYATEFGANVALDQTDPDDTYTTGCSDASGNWNTIVLPGGTLNFTKYWDGDSHNPFGPTATPIIFKTITIQGNGTTLQWAWTPATSPLPGHFRLFAIGEASISPTHGVLTAGTYSGTGNLTLQNVYVTGFNVKGGDGAGGGGGGLGAGGAIFVSALPGSGSPGLTVQNSTFVNNSATGGNGGGGLFGGGGGLNGNGGHSTYPAVGGGGGGGSRGDGGNGGLNACLPNDYRCESGGGGGGTVYSGGNATGDPNNNEPGPGGYLCGGSGGGPGVIHNGYVTNVDGITPDPTNCPGGGGGGGAYNDYFLGGNGKGGDGSYGGGGGGGPAGGGNGGFGGGGGGGDTSDTGGHGGFGGGGAVGQPGGKFGGNGGACTGADDCGGGGGGALGGAIFNGSGVVVIQNSTFYQNAVLRGVGGGSGVDNGGDGGGAIFSYFGSLTIQNSTIADNAASGAGGGVETALNGTLVLQNTIIANNGAAECITGGIVNTDKSAANLITANSSCPNVSVTTDPQLDSPKPNAPGNTPTMAITSASSAYDAGDDNTALGTDQRGVQRPQGAHSDIGAFELVPSADLSVTKSVSSTTAQPGDTLTYTIVVKNAGPQAATSVTMSDTFPSSLTYLSCSATNGGSCSYSGGSVSVTYGSLAVGESETITIQGTLNANAQDGLLVSNTANVSASSPVDPNTGDNSASASFTVHNRADLAVAKTVTTSSPYSPNVEAGDSLTYTVTLTNKGPYDARSVVLSDSAPTGVTFTGCSSSVGTCVWSASGASLTLASFTNASVATMTINATLNFNVADQSLITNSASVASTTFDPDTTNNSASASFTALNNSDLFITQGNVKLANRQLKYTVSVKNLGKYLAKQLVLNNALPSGSTFVSLAPGPWACSSPAVGASGTISCKLTSEAVGTTQGITFVVKVKTPGNVLVSNTASIGESTYDPNLGNNTSNTSTKVGP